MNIEVEKHLDKLFNEEARRYKKRVLGKRLTGYEINDTSLIHKNTDKAVEGTIIDCVYDKYVDGLLFTIVSDDNKKYQVTQFDKISIK